jgi:hypothetical protein
MLLRYWPTLEQWRHHRHVQAIECQWGYFGSVMYVHVQNRSPQGIYNVSPNPYQGFQGSQVGQFAGDCNCPCAHGIHVHVQRLNGAARGDLHCDSNVTQWGSYLYYWNI